MKKAINKLDKDAQAARDAGISYGRYKAKQYEAERWKQTTIQCLDKFDAQEIGDAIGWINVVNWIFDTDGGVTLILRRGYKLCEHAKK